MSRTRTRFVCQTCGHEALRWLGRCPDCSSWNTLVETVVEPRPGRSAAGRSAGDAGAPVLVREIRTDAHPRVPTGIAEFDRVLGGGCVPGSVVLIGGDPGIGKSTLLMQVASRLAREEGRTLYVTGEESVHQVKMRAERLELDAGDLLLAAETDLDRVEGFVESEHPRYLVIDSIQTMVDGELTASAATVSQVRACCDRLTRLAKRTGLSLFLVGHVTKDGSIAGPRVIEHLVDTVLYFEGDRTHAHRILRSVKNRFGSSDEIGIFQMGERGLAGVGGASEFLLAQRPAHGLGSAVAAVVEGSRAMLVEIQALVSRSYFQSPRRLGTGVDHQRLCMVLAVLEKRCGFRLADRDVYVNVTGGLRVIEPAADLAMALAVASTYRDVAVAADTVVAGEIGLAGEVRAVQRTEQRLREAARLGFCRALIAAPGPPEPADGCEALTVAGVGEALERGLEAQA